MSLSETFWAPAGSNHGCTRRSYVPDRRGSLSQRADGVWRVIPVRGSHSGPGSSRGHRVVTSAGAFGSVRGAWTVGMLRVDRLVAVPRPSALACLGREGSPCLDLRLRSRCRLSEPALFWSGSYEGAKKRAREGRAWSWYEEAQRRRGDFGAGWEWPSPGMTKPRACWRSTDIRL